MILLVKIITNSGGVKILRHVIAVHVKQLITLNWANYFDAIIIFVPILSSFQFRREKKKEPVPEERRKARFLRKA